MSTTTTQSVVVSPIKEFFCDSFEECKRATGIIPDQVLGLAPCDIEDEDDCRPDPCQTLKVFANGSGVDRENDRSYYLFDFPTATGNDYKLERWDTSTETWSFVRDLDNTTGTIFDFGAFASYPNRSGIMIDWASIQALEGNGVYRITLEGLFGTPTPKLVTLPYKLCTFSCVIAEETVRVKTTVEGGFVDSIKWFEGSSFQKTFDLEFMSWEDQLRYTGNFFDEPAQRVTNTFVKSNNRRQTHRTFLKKLFKLTINDLIQDLVDRLDMYGGFAQIFRVSNYDDGNSKHYTDRDVTIEDSTTEYSYNLTKKIAIVQIQMQDRYDREGSRC